MRRLALAIALVVTTLAGTTGPASAAGTERVLRCSGNAGPAYTQRTVTARITASNRVRAVVVRDQFGGVISRRTGPALAIGASDLHAGYVAWDVTGVNPDGDVYSLHLPPVLPGGGGFSDADLNVDLAGGASGALQIPMFDCTVRGGTWAQRHPAGPRHVSCTTMPGQPGTNYRITAGLSRSNRPRNSSITSLDSGATVQRTGRAGALGASVLRAGFTQWNLTGPNPDHNRYRLHVAPVLPARGGFFDADLEILLNGGSNGALQLVALDCRVTS